MGGHKCRALQCTSVTRLHMRKIYHNVGPYHKQTVNLAHVLAVDSQGAVAFPRGRYGAGTGTIWLDDVSCAGSEQYLDMCAYRPWGHSNCAHREDVSVSCGGQMSSKLVVSRRFPRSAHVGLQSGPLPSSGSVSSFFCFRVKL